MKQLYLFILTSLLLISCRHSDVVPTNNLHLQRGLFILNEGNMGSNKATIDFYDPAIDSIYRDIYPTVNPTVVKELGDVGNDIAIYGGKLYALINVSGKVEIMDLQGHRISQIDIPNCRSICFEGRYAYVSSYAGPVKIDAHYEQRGYVAKIDTSSLTIIDTCHVGYQPNGVACDGKYLYVANSGGYMYPNFDSTISVVPLDRFIETERIIVAKNLNELLFDQAHGILYVSSIGDYASQPASVYEIDIHTHTVRNLGVGASHMHLTQQGLYCLNGSQYGKTTSLVKWEYGSNAPSIIPLDNQSEYVCAYGLFVDETTGDIYVTDARDYVTPGVLFRYQANGQLISRQRTGDIPAHMVMKEQ